MTAYVFDQRKLRSPLLVVALLIAFAVWQAAWLALVGLPLVYLGWRGCAPNLNLADGFLPLLSTGIAVAFALAVDSAGLHAAGAACGATWLLASLEAAWRCRPAELPAEPPVEGEGRRNR